MNQNRGIVIGIFVAAVIAATTITLTASSILNLQAVNTVESGKTIVHAGGPI